MSKIELPDQIAAVRAACERSPSPEMVAAVRTLEWLHTHQNSVRAAVHFMDSWPMSQITRDFPGAKLINIRDLAPELEEVDP